MVRLIIIDKNVLYRDCMIAVLKSAAGMKVIGFNGIDGLSGIKSNNNNNLIILTADNDVYTTGKIIHKARRLYPRTPILVYGGNQSEKFKNQIINQGAQSYFDTNHTPSEFIKIIKQTSGQKVEKPPGLRKNNNGNAQTPQEKLQRLSNRELTVLKMIASGKSVKTISDELSLKISTVHTFRTRLMNKLKLKNNVEIALFAITNKIVSSMDIPK